MTDDTERHVIPEPEATPPVETTTSAGAPAPGGFQASPALVTPMGPNRVRWAVALGVAGLAIAVTVGAILLLGANQTPEALRYIPGSSALVAELRLDLPGDQMQKLGNLLAHFPGFKDQSTLADKIDESLTRLVSAASDNGLDYRTDLKPWLSGAAFMGAAAPSKGGSPESMVISATTNGAADCTKALTGTVSHETYLGLELVIGGDSDQQLACVIDGRQALLGDTASVRAGLDAKAAGTGMDKNDRYRAARAALGGDRIATMFVSGAAFADLMSAPSGGTGGLPDLGSFDPLGGLGGLTDLAGAIPDWTIVGLRAEDDALVVDTVAAPVPDPTSGASQLPLPATHASNLAGMLPANTIAFVEHQGAGVALQNFLAKMKSNPALGESLGVLDGLGGAGQLLGWIEDAGIAVVGGTGGPGFGALLVAGDDAQAAAQITTLKSLLGLAGLSGGGVEVTETTISGVEVTTITIADLGALVPPGTLPDGMPAPSTSGSPITFSLAAKGRVVLVGVGDSFMTSVLGTGAGSSLADSATYKGALARSLTNSRTTVYVGVASGRELISGFLPAESLATWQSDVLPYVEPIQVLAITSSSDAAASRSRVVITVANP